MEALDNRSERLDPFRSRTWLSRWIRAGALGCPDLGFEIPRPDIRTFTMCRDGLQKPPSQ